MEELYTETGISIWGTIPLKENQTNFYDLLLRKSEKVFSQTLSDKERVQSRPVPVELWPPPFQECWAELIIRY